MCALALLLGYGTGDMTMTQAARGERLETVTRTDLTMRLGAVGARGALLEAGETGGLDLALRGDAFLVQMDSASAANTVETKADASRLRLVLEGSRAFALGEGAVLTPGLEVGLRHDGGDAETGTGVEVGGRIRYADAGSGLTVEASARTLVAHEDSGYREWGAGGSVRLDPGASGRGLSLSLAPVWGTPSSGVERLWSARDAARLAPGGEFEAEQRLEGELGYGIGLPPPQPEDPLGFFEPVDPIRRFRKDGSLAINTKQGTWNDHRSGEGGSIVTLLGRLLGSRQAAREWIRYDHEEERRRPHWRPPWLQSRAARAQPQPAEPHDDGLGAMLGRESIHPPPPPSNSPQLELWPDASAEAVVRKNLEAAADQAEMAEAQFREELAGMTPEKRGHVMARLHKATKRNRSVERHRAPAPRR